MAAKPKGGRLSVTGPAAGGPLVGITVRVDAARATDEFKRIRSDINTAMRDAMARAGERTIVPAIKSALPVKDPGTKRGLPSSAMASSITIKRDRLDVVIKSTLPARLDRALGWIDFGGKRPRDTVVRVGSRALVSQLDAKRSAIDKAVLEELRHQFRDFEFT